MAEELSEVYCVNFEQSKSLLTANPENARAFLMRVVLFQERLEKRHGLSWWSSLNVLRRHEPFAGCSDAFIEAVAPFMQVRFCLPGEAIVEEGDHVDHALIIETGSAKVHRQTKPALRGCPDRTGEVRDSDLLTQQLDFKLVGFLIFCRKIKSNLLFPLGEVRLPGGWHQWGLRLRWNAAPPGHHQSSQLLQLAGPVVPFALFVGVLGPLTK